MYVGVGNMCTLITIASLFSLMQDGTTPLYMASQNGHEGAVKLLLDKGANVNQQDKVYSTVCLTVCHLYKMLIAIEITSQ